MNKRVMLMIMTVLLVTLLPAAHAELDLNRIQFDPAIIAAGDTVDIVIEYEAKPTPFSSERVGQQEYTFDARLKPDDDMTREYVRILDSEGDDRKGHVFSGEIYNKVFRIKVATDAPTGPYQFELEGQWYRNGEPIDYQEQVHFTMDVKKEGIILNAASIDTSPQQVRPGDEFVELKTHLENTGHKDAESIEVKLNSDHSGITPSYADDNRKWMGRLNTGESKPMTFSLDLAEDLPSGVYDLTAELSYRDVDENQYNTTLSLPLRVKSRPYLEIVNYSGSGRAGTGGELQVWVKNVGEDSAEATDVRIIKQAAQPFAFDVRSDYVGELEPGETGQAIFHFDVLSGADIKSHDFQLFLRAKGDSDEGDDTIYTFYRQAEYQVTGEAPNYWVYAGVVLLLLLGAILGFKTIRKGGKKKR
jgi:hypothetical protein